MVDAGYLTGSDTLTAGIAGSYLGTLAAVGFTAGVVYSTFGATSTGFVHVAAGFVTEGAAVVAAGTSALGFTLTLTPPTPLQLATL
jgi:hypothetical protein